MSRLIGSVLAVAVVTPAVALGASRDEAGSRQSPADLVALQARIDADRDALAREGVYVMATGRTADPCVAMWLANPTEPNIQYLERRYGQVCVRRKPEGYGKACGGARARSLRRGPVTVPDVRGLGIEVATRRLVAAGLTFTIACLGDREHRAQCRVPALARPARADHAAVPAARRGCAPRRRGRARRQGDPPGRLRVPHDVALRLRHGPPAPVPRRAQPGPALGRAGRGERSRDVACGRRVRPPSSATAASSSFARERSQAVEDEEGARGAPVSRVRVPWRQFQRRQVTPTSSRQTISPGRGGLDAAARVEALAAGGKREPRADRERVAVLAADEQEVAHGDRVVEVDEPFTRGSPSPWSTRARAPPPRREAARLGPEGRTRRAMPRSRRVRGAGEPPARTCSLGLRQPPVAVRPARPVDSPSATDRGHVVGCRSNTRGSTAVSITWYTLRKAAHRNDPRMPDRST